MRLLASLLVASFIAGCGQQAPVERPALPAPAPGAATAAAAAPAPVVAPAPARAAPASAAPAAAASAAAARLPAIIDWADAGALARVSPAGQDAAAAAIAIADGALTFAAAPEAPWPGISIRPPGEAWDLSAAGGVEAVLENGGEAAVQIGLRIDQQGGGRDSWNGENLRLEPGKGGRVAVAFGRSFGKPGFALDPARVGRIQVYVVKPGPGCRVRVRSLAAVGKEAFLPAIPASIPTRRPAGDPRVWSFADGIDAQRVKASGGALAAHGGAALLTLAGGRGEIVVRPARPLDLRDFTQAAFALANPGPVPVQVACRLLGATPDDRAQAEAELAPGERRTVVVPFAGAPWRGVTPQPKDGTPTAGQQGAPVEASSAGLVNDAVGQLALTVRGAAGAQLAWEGVAASAGAPAAVPAWVGTRPPVPGDWVQVWADEFDGSALDLTRWTPRLPWIGPIPYELQCYVERNVLVRDGSLVIRCTREDAHLYDNPAWPLRHYATGALTTYDKWSWRYGYAEARMKLPRALGLWPGFWTMPDRGAQPGAAPPAGDWLARWEASRANPDKNRRRSTDVDGMEFDIMEHCTRFGPFRYNIAAHWDGYGKDHRALGTSRVYARGDADGWIVSGLLWEPGRLAWYCNGELVGSWQDPRVATVPASIKFTMQMGGWARNEVDDSALPDEFRVDWLRVWQLRERLPAPAAQKAP